jgi:hypothetical protein
MSNEEMSFRAKMMSDLKDAQIKGFIKLSMSQMRLIVDMAAAAVGEWGVTSSPGHQRQPENTPEQ